jgi:hypothetical protein
MGIAPVWRRPGAKNSFIWLGIGTLQLAQLHSKVDEATKPSSAYTNCFVPMPDATYARLARW